MAIKREVVGGLVQMAYDTSLPVGLWRWARGEGGLFPGDGADGHEEVEAWELVGYVEESVVDFLA